MENKMWKTFTITIYLLSKRNYVKLIFSFIVRKSVWEKDFFIFNLFCVRFFQLIFYLRVEKKLFIFYFVRFYSQNKRKLNEFFHSCSRCWLFWGKRKVFNLRAISWKDCKSFLRATKKQIAVFIYFNDL